MTILFAASEMAPLARTGSRADSVAALSAALRARGHEVSVVLPCYRGLRDRPGTRPTGVTIPVQAGPKLQKAEILEIVEPNGVQVFLIRLDEYFDRPTLFGEEGQPFEDNAERFIFFSRAVVELVRRILPPPEIIHVHDWETALVPVLMRERRLPFRTVLTVNDFARQGSFWAFDFGLTGLPCDYFTERGVEYYGNINLLKGGLLYAEQIATVSGSYARAIQSPEGGCGLDPVLRLQAHKLTGILPGLDDSTWNPQTDATLPAHFGPGDLAGKRACRDALLTKLDLAPNPLGPVFAMVAPLASRTGYDLLLPLVDRLLADDVRLIILGSSETGFARELLIADRRHQGRFAFLNTWDAGLEHLVFAGADIALSAIPPEPGGESVLRALHYGAVPLACAAAGVDEVVTDLDPATGTGNGFLAFIATPEALWDTIKRAKRSFAEPSEWNPIVERGMRSDVSWGQAATRYEAVYRSALGRKA